MSEHHNKQAAEQQRRFPGFSAPPSPSPSAFSQVFLLLFMECPNPEPVRMLFGMKRLPSTLPRLSDIAAALQPRPSLSRCPPFPALVFVWCVPSLPHAQTHCCSAHYFPTASPDGDGQRSVGARVRCPHTRLRSPFAPPMPNGNAFTLICTRAEPRSRSLEPEPGQVLADGWISKLSSSLHGSVSLRGAGWPRQVTLLPSQAD